MSRTSNTSRVSWLVLMSHFHIYIYIYMSQMTAAQHVPDSQHITRVMATASARRILSVRVAQVILSMHAPCCSVLQCVAVHQCACCSGVPIYLCMHGIFLWYRVFVCEYLFVLCRSNGVCTTDAPCACRAGDLIYVCTMLQCVAVCCSVLQCVAVRCSACRSGVPIYICTCWIMLFLFGFSLFGYLFVLRHGNGIGTVDALQCVASAMCGSVFSVLRYIAVRGSAHASLSKVLLCVCRAGESFFVCCSVVYCVAMCCSVLQCVAVCGRVLHYERSV